MTHDAIHQRAWRWFWPAHTIDIALLCVFALILSDAVSFPPAARLFPMIVSSGGILLVLARLTTSSGFAPVDLQESGGIAKGDETRDRFRVVLAILSAPIYALLVWSIGFYAASLLTLVIFPYLLGFHRFSILIPTALVLVLLLASVFSYAMDMTLPPGLLGNWVLTNFIYDR